MKSIDNELESTDAAGRVPHPSPTRPDAGRGVRLCCPRVGATSELFFISRIRTDSTQFAPTRLDSRRIELIRPESGHIGSYRPVTETGRKQSKQAEIGLESSRNS